MANQDVDHRTGEKITLVALVGFFIWRAAQAHSSKNFRTKPAGAAASSGKAQEVGDASAVQGTTEKLTSAFVEAVKTLERKIPELGILFSFWIALFFLIGIGAYYAHNGHAAQTLDYCAYAFPFCGALSAGLASFHDKIKSILFVLALIFLSLGVEAYMASHTDSAVLVSVTNALLFVFLVGALAVQMIISIKNAFNSRASTKTITEVILYAISLLICVFAASFSAFFFVFNSRCMEPHVKLSECGYTFSDAWREFFLLVGQLLHRAI